MSLTFEPFAPAHLDAAAALIAARHRRDRLLFPDLSPLYEDPDRMRPLLAASLEMPSSSGVVALRDGRVTGYLLAEMQLSGTLRHTPPRSMLVPYTGHALAAAEELDTYRQLYAAAAPRWLASGSYVHYVEVVADAAALGTWASLGLGQVMTYGLRDTAPSEHQRPRANVEIPHAGSEDLEVVTRLECDNLRFHAGSPAFVPWMDEVEPENSVHLQHGYTEADVRGGGIGSALLEHGLAWARERGAAFCTVNWFSANLLGARFWTGSGFRPIRYRLARHIDPRIAWAGSAADA